MKSANEFPPPEPAEPRKAFLPIEARDEDERAELSLLRDQLLSAVGSGNKDELSRVKELYEHRFPKEGVAIETLFDIVGYLDTQRAVYEMKQRDGRASMELYRSLTEYNFLLSHFVRTNRESRPFLESFWQLLQNVAGRWGRRGEEVVGKLRAGVVTQIGISRAFEELHEDTESAHPSDDAFRCTDLWTEDHPVQVKGVKQATPELIEVPAITYPATKVRRGTEDRYYTSHFDRDIDRFSFNVRKYADQREHRAASGYFVVVPYRMVDSVTGEPSPELVDFLAERTAARSELKEAA